MREIPLSGWQAGGRSALVDDCDYERLSKYKWKAKRSGGGVLYAVRNTVVGGRNVTLRMHRVVLGYEGTEDIDHINRNSIDNRKSNLRVCTRAENLRNSDLVAEARERNLKYGRYLHRRVGA
jgi:hypothetical protein